MIINKIINQQKYVIPRVPYIVSDHPEAQKIAGMFQPTNAKMPCRMCLVQSGLHNWHHVGPPRVEAVMKSVAAIDRHKYSLQQEDNRLWKVPGLDVFKIPACRMHSCDHGIFVNLWEMVVAAANKVDMYDQLEKNLGNVGDFPQLKKFRHGIEDKAFITAGEHRILAINLPFILQGLADDDRTMKTYQIPSNRSLGGMDY